MEEFYYLLHPQFLTKIRDLPHGYLFRQISSGLFKIHLNTRLSLKTKEEFQCRRDSSIGIATDYGLVDRMNRVRFPMGSGNFSLRRRVQTTSEAHPASYPMGTEGSFHGALS
jgi:hypothetical protein